MPAIRAEKVNNSASLATPNLAGQPPSLASPEEIIDEARNGRMFILIDDEDRENEGDLVIPAQMATPDAINFMATHGRGLICLALTRPRCQQLGLELMSRSNGTRHETAFTVSIEARHGVTTGISAADRACTVSVAIDASKARDDLVTPGHIFPLIARDGGVLVRPGHTEASVDIARLAGLNPSGVICEIMNDDGSMARLHQLIPFARKHRLKIGTIRDLIAFRHRFDRVVECISSTRFVSEHGGEWHLLTYRNKFDKTDNFVLQKGEISPQGQTLVRMHTASLLSDLLGEHGTGGRAIPRAMEQVARAGGGLIVLMVPRTDSGLSLHTARSADLDTDRRTYGVGAQILADLGVHDIVLLTNSHQPQPVGLEGYGFRIVREQPFDAGE
ncbi:3,4-dihydroxy-2-butanone-4-phosphate synthase [Nitrospirillum viridazoti]|uniref:3,4-dihydroxy-2-butanone 4-phosphate synthase n=1 Tax=Nitrospirillum amazonense TaxID=28077 RepID=A0A560HKD5_9PROT|nr:3,4-dihydroxy-2-butanone-4-phosphate synthase [Nitrospirillum amazonense]TWB46968.1 GTP cyclohydrolase II /3,4-dihydroxy-2-butanone 4-phosphate synthase [Nitrospirillum amazonense]